MSVNWTGGSPISMSPAFLWHISSFSWAISSPFCPGWLFSENVGPLKICNFQSNAQIKFSFRFAASGYWLHTWGVNTLELFSSTNRQIANTRRIKNPLYCSWNWLHNIFNNWLLIVVFRIVMLVNQTPKTPFFWNSLETRHNQTVNSWLVSIVVFSALF